MKINEFKKYIILILILSSFFYTLYINIENVKSSANNNELTIHYIDVGQGDSTLIITPNKKTILIDAGDEDHSKKVINYIKRQHISNLDLVIATHPDADHIGGMDKIIKEFDIGLFAMPDIDSDTSQYSQINKELQKKNIIPKELYLYDELYIDDSIEFEILSPEKDKSYSDRNNSSIVSKLTYKENSFLFMGDASIDNEISIINNVPDIDVDVLKLGHHGSSTSTSEYFLTKTTPSIAIISCGKNNKYSHPHKSVVELLDKYSVSTFRTDILGNIVISSDGTKIKSSN